MLRRSFAGFIFLSLASAMIGPFDALSQVPKPECPDIPRPLSAVSPPGRFGSPVFEKVQVEKDLFVGEVTTSEGKKANLLLDFYSPEGDPNPGRPAVLLIHGGGFKPGTVRTQGYVVTLAQKLAQRGYVCAAVEYRVRTNPDLDWSGTLNDCLADVDRAFQWIRSNSGGYRIDSEHVVVIGGSAGGMIGLNYVAKDKNRRGISAFVNLWGSPNHQELWPVGIDSCYPPTLIIHGTKDITVPFEAGIEFAKRLTEARVKNLLVPLPDAPHTPLAHLDKIVETVSNFLYECLTGGKPSR